MIYKVWNKEEKINGVDAQHIKDNLNIQEDDEVFLIINEYNRVTNIEIASTIKENYKLDIDLSVEQVAEEYIGLLKSEEEIAKEGNALASNRIKVLEVENANITYALMMGGLI